MEAEAKKLWWELQGAKVPFLGSKGQEGGEVTSKHEALPWVSQSLKLVSPSEGVSP